MRLLLLGLMLAMALSGCANKRAKADYYQTTIVSGWVGVHSQKLWDAWGPPTETMESPNGQIVYLYETAKVIRSANSSSYIGYGLALGSGTTVTLECESFFNVNRETKIIESADWRGGNCEAESPEEKAERRKRLNTVGP